MRDEKLCPTCGGDLIWRGNVLEGRLACPHCAQVETISEPAELPVRIAILKEEEEEWENSVDANIKALNKARKFEDREFDDPTAMMSARRTGKTHAMVVRALEEASNGNPVIILVHHHRMVDYVQGIMYRMGLERKHGMMMVPAPRAGFSYGSIRVLPVVSDPRGVSRDVKVFADHSIFEQDRDRRVQEAFNEWWSRYEIRE